MKPTRRGFTLVELMIVVAIIGVLAALAVYGVRRYLATAKTSEAKQVIGAIMRAAINQITQEKLDAETLAEGSQSKGFTNPCFGAIPVPKTVPKGTKYQPKTGDGVDFQSGSNKIGWKCLNFNMDQPIYYQYHYSLGKSVVAPNHPSPCAGQCLEVGAIGDLDGDGAFSRFALIARATKAGIPTTDTAIHIENELE